MRSLFTIGGLVAALGVGYFLYSRSLTTSGGTVTPPQQQIDVVDIRTHLLNIGQAEKMYVVNHGTYGSIEQMQQDGSPTLLTENRGYAFSIVINGAQSFTATATPTDPNKAGWPTLEIDETMTITQR